MPRRLDGKPDRGGIAIRRLVDAGQLADEALARAADQHGVTRRGEATGSRDQLELMRDALAEADAGIDGDAIALDSARLAQPGTLHQEGAHVLDDVAVG